MQSTIQELRRAAQSHRPLLLRGERGTGKTAAAEGVHRASGRPGEFVVANLAGMPAGCKFARLFGHRRGAFTGAVSDVDGDAQRAHRGTLFLDEIADYDHEMQTALLTFLDRGEVPLIGSSESRKVDVRIIAATNKDLEAEVAAGRFREDLYDRLCRRCIVLPPLREHPEDIPLLAAAFHSAPLSDQALAVLKAHSWPGNVRQLQTVLDTATEDRGGAVIRPEELEMPPAPRAKPAPADPRPADRGWSTARRQTHEQRATTRDNSLLLSVLSALAEMAGAQRAAARHLGWTWGRFRAFVCRMTARQLDPRQMYMQPA
jgi:DNA-binding NtrC family response regulator